ncbi:uncharacterized protein LOC116053175 [Sander lucioperca]|uniref:uncharacterized protein LOC116053175 n=1 Tax=Sander lucioperca TaxID=283035 RepID=UPI00125D71FE|nr:uncharacterized protein LOC116053175 [Sander lucioperca]
MEERLSVLLCIALLPSFILAIDNILGDKVTFQETEKCKTSRATLVWLKDGSERPVARWDGVWKPEQGYEDRLSPNECVSLNQTNMNDNGLYVLTCGPDSETRTSLHVVPASEALVSEGEPGRLEFHHFTVGKRGEFRMERNGELVLELDLSSGEMRHGTGFEDRLSVSPGWKLSGDLTVTLQDVKPDDQGDFFIYVQDEDETRPREGLSAVRLKIREKIPDQTTRTPPTAAAGICLTQKEMITWTVVCILLAVVLMALVFFCCWLWLRFWKPNVPSGPGGGTCPTPTDGTDVELQPLTEPCPPGSHVNGSLRPNANGQ